MGSSLPHRQLVDIGGRLLSARLRGQGPMVVLDAGGAGEGTAGAWGAAVEDRLAASATVLTYDRAGSGHSDGRQHSRVAAMADDVAALIGALGCSGPVVLAGWSSGGLVAQMFAVRYPERLAGLVLVDPSEPPPVSLARDTRMVLSSAQLRLFTMVSRLGFFRTRAGRALARRMAGPDISPEGLEYAYRQWSNPKELSRTATTVARVVTYAQETAAALRVGPVPDIPVKVVVPQRRTGFPPAYAEHLDAAHAAIARRAPRGELITAADASHAVPVDRPDVVTTAILDILQTTREDSAE